MLQVRKWYENFVGEVDDGVKKESLMEGRVTCNQSIGDFEVEVNALHYVRAPGIYLHDMWVTHLKQTSATECAIQFSRKCLLAGETLDPVDFIGNADAIAPPGFIMILSSSPRRFVDAVLCGN